MWIRKNQAYTVFVRINNKYDSVWWVLKYPPTSINYQGCGSENLRNKILTNYISTYEPYKRYIYVYSFKLQINRKWLYIIVNPLVRIKYLSLPMLDFCSFCLGFPPIFFPAFVLIGEGLKIIAIKQK